MTELSLIVLRAVDLDHTLAFYTALDLEFTPEQHGSGPLHYSAPLGTAIIEIYPGQPGTAPDRRTAGAVTLGFHVPSLDSALERLNAKILTPPQTSPWGRRAVVADPDGRAVELNESVK